MLKMSVQNKTHKQRGGKAHRVSSRLPLLQNRDARVHLSNLFGLDRACKYSTRRANGEEKSEDH